MKSDQQLCSDVASELTWDPSLSAHKIHVSVQQGTVTLSGQVRSQWQKRSAETAALRVKGICGIYDRLEILPSSLN